MKKFVIMLSLSLMSPLTFGLELVSKNISCIDDDSAMEITIEKYGTNKVIAKVYNLDLNRDREEMTYKSPRLTYNSDRRVYTNKDRSVEVTLYRSKDKRYGAAIELLEDGFFNDMFECKSI